MNGRYHIQVCNQLLEMNGRYHIQVCNQLLTRRKHVINIVVKANPPITTIHRNTVDCV